MGKTINHVSWVVPTDERNFTSIYLKFTDGFQMLLEVTGLGLLDLQPPEGYNGPGMYEAKLKATQVYDDGLNRGFEFTFDNKRKEIECQLFRFQCESLEHAKSLFNLNEVEYVKWVGKWPQPVDYEGNNG